MTKKEVEVFVLREQADHERDQCMVALHKRRKQVAKDHLLKAHELEVRALLIELGIE